MPFRDIPPFRARNAEGDTGEGEVFGWLCGLLRGLALPFRCAANDLHEAEKRENNTPAPAASKFIRTPKPFV